MGQGLRIDYGDGSPVMEITSGMRCPSFCNRVENQWDNNEVSINNYVSGSQILVIPRDPVVILTRGTNLVRTIGMINGWSQSGNVLKFNTWWSDNWGRSRLFDLTVAQILPSSSGQGLLIKDSTDFMSIQDASMSGYCVFSGEISFTGEWRTPDTNIDRGRYIVFAKWSQDGVVVEFDGDKIYARKETERDDEDASITMRVAIFASGVAPERGDGLTMINSSGQCVFSTKKRPMIFNNRYWRPSWDWKDIGDGMLMLGRYGFKSRNPDGWCRAKFAGVIRNGNSVRCGVGVTSGKWTGRYAVEQDRLVPIDFPIVENMY